MINADKRLAAVKWGILKLLKLMQVCIVNYLIALSERDSRYFLGTCYTVDCETVFPIRYGVVTLGRVSAKLKSLITGSSSDSRVRAVTGAYSI